MFGYVRPYAPSLTLGDYEFYRATYCGVCRSLKRETGVVSGLSLNYDMVFLALVRLLLGDRQVKIQPGRCVAHPLKKRPMLRRSQATAYAARICATLTYYKLKDDLRDSGALGKVAPGLALPFMRRARKKARLGRLDESMREHLSRLSQMEKEQVASIDLPAGEFGALLGEVFAFDAPGEFYTPLYTLGDMLGRFIYAADAAEDFEKDKKSGSYNPYVLTYGDTLTEAAKADIHTALICTLSRGEAAWQTLPFGDSVTVRHLIENILYEGLPRRVAYLVGGEKFPARKKPKPYDGPLP